MKSPLEILQLYWGYNEFRNPQEEIIKNVLNSENSLVLLPTSGGKSICYQIPALILDGICIVISPLIALIHDQVNSLKEKNIKAIALTSQLSEDEVIVAFDNLQFGGYKFLYLSPEKLQSKFVQEKIKQLNVSLIAIDEAHCISEWGHDFRPSYLELKILKELKPSATFIALTATATSKVLKDIQENLNLTDAVIFKKSFQRNNLSYHILNTENIYGKLIQIINRISDAVIVYTNNRKQTKEVCNLLLKNNLKSSFYHGGLSAAEKNESYQNWMNDKTPIMVATNAFGMGIDKANVRAVIHINTPNSLENFIQEAGRAGRDGKDSHSIVLTNKSVLFDAQHKFSTTIASTDYVKKVYFKLNQFFNVSMGELPLESFNFSIQEFCNTYGFNLLQTYNAIKTLERENILLLDENYSRKSTLKFTINNRQLFSFLEKNKFKKPLIQLLLRSYGGIFEHQTIINEYVLSKKLKTSKSNIINSLKELNDKEIIKYNYANTSSKLSFLVIREDNYTINSVSKNIKQQNNLKFEKLKASIDFIKNNKICRNIQILTYFNETLKEPCGKCDICLKKSSNSSSIELINSQIIDLLKKRAFSSNELSTSLTFTEDEILNSLKILLEQGKITITSQNKFKLTI